MMNDDDGKEDEEASTSSYIHYSINEQSGLRVNKRRNNINVTSVAVVVVVVFVTIFFFMVYGRFAHHIALSS